MLFPQRLHKNISVMYIVQNLFHRGKHNETISRNAHYMVLFKNLTDVSQIMALAHQMYPRRTQFFLEAFATDFFVSALNPALFLLRFFFCSLVNGTLPLKILSAHSHRQSTRLRSALVMRCLRIHGFVFCKYTISLPCFCKLWETMLMYPRRTQFFLEAFARATARPHGYMVIDMKQNTPCVWCCERTVGQTSIFHCL
jgi:hypothetical protein